MWKRRLIAIFLCLLLTCTVYGAERQSSPYAIRVNRALNTATIYTRDANGEYTIPYKAMICSTARPGHVTPLGSYTLAAYRSPWRLMLDGTYGQYATCFSGHYLFHSICYSDDSHDAMVRDSYNRLGEPASMGCVRLETKDAKWIFDNCPAGTPVTVYDDYASPGPLGKPKRTLDYISEAAYNGWDPTDPAEGNPWRQLNVQAVTVTPGTLTMTAGEKAVLTGVTVPDFVGVYWESSNEAVATVDQNGIVVALSAGTAEIRAVACNGVSAACAVEVSGELLPFDDLVPGAWYYKEMREILEKDLFSGLGNRRFAPDAPMTRAMVVQVLYNLEKQPKSREDLSFADVAEDGWYYDAVAWAVSEGLVQGVSQREFQPDRAMSRQELATILWRYCEKPQAQADLTAFFDGGTIGTFAREALSWMVEQQLLRGSGGQLRPADPVSRVETAAIFQRMLQSE